jgi:O-antigen ligase
VASLSIHLRRPTYHEAVLLGLILLASSGDLSRNLSIGGFSGLGGLSVAAGCAVWAAWLLRPVLPPRLLIVLLPLIFFVIDAAGTLMWYKPAKTDGIQLLVVVLTFLGTLMLAARESAAKPHLAAQLRSILLATSMMPVAYWLVVLVSGMLPPDQGNATRGFALYAMIIAAAALATWREFFWPEKRRGDPPPPRRGWFKPLWPFAYVGVISFVVLLGMSRTALIAIALSIPLSLIYRGSVKSVLQGCVMLAIGGGIFAAVLFSYQPLYDRFFKEDASMHVGGVAINATGRTKIWNLLLNDVGDDWVFGKGISASEDLVSRTIPNVGQPHNDYIRFYYDQGIVGLGLWLTFILGFVYRTIANLRRSIRNRSDDYPEHLAALLAVTSVSFSMLTDNSYCYAFVMFPLAIVMGCSLGSARQSERQHTDSAGFEPVCTI